MNLIFVTKAVTCLPIKLHKAIFWLSTKSAQGYEDYLWLKLNHVCFYHDLRILS